MNTELHKSCRLLQAKDQAGAAPLERYTSETWDFIDQKFPDFGPSWYRELTQNFRIAGADFHYPIDDREYIGYCTIVRPSSALLYFYSGYPFPKLAEQGYFCFAEGDDGNLWMFRNDSEADPPVYFLEHTSWDGGDITVDNELIIPDITLSQLLRHGASWAPKD